MMDRMFSPLSRARERPRITLSIILAVFLILTTTGAYIAALEWDEGSFLLNAEYIQGTDENFEESRPHTISYLVAGIWMFTGENTFTARLFIVLFGAATILMFYYIAGQEFENPLPVTAAFAFTPLLLYWSFHVYTDVIALFFVLASYYLFRKKKHLFAGILMSVAVTVRYVFLVFAVGMVVGYLIEHRDALPSYAVGGIVGALPFFTYSYIGYGGVFSRIRMYVTRVSEWSGSEPFAATIGSTASAVMMLSTLIPAAYTGWQDTPMVEKSMVLVYTAFFLFISGNSFPRYWLAVVPFLLLMSYRGLADRRVLFVLAVAGMILVSGISVGTTFTTLQTCSDPFNDAIDHVKELDGIVVSDRWAITGYLLDRTVYSPWTDYETLRDEEGVRYAVTTDDLPYQKEATYGNMCRTYHVYDLHEPE